MRVALVEDIFLIINDESIQVEGILKMPSTYATNHQFNFF